MKTSKQIKEERAVADEKIKLLRAKESLTDAETAELTQSMDARDKATLELETALRLEKIDAENAALEARKAGSSESGKNNSGEGKELRRFSLSKLIVAAEGGPESRKVDAGFEMEVLSQYADGEDAQTLKTKNKEGRSFYIPENVLDAVVEKRTTMNATTAGQGANFVQTDKVGFFDQVFNVSVLDKMGVQKLTGLSSNVDLKGFSAGITSAWAAETGTQTATDATTVNRSLTPNLLYTAVDVSRRLIMQTNPSIDQYLLVNMMRSMAQKIEQGFVNGTGSDQMLGILSTANIQDVAIGATGGAPTYPAVLDLITAVLQAGAPGATPKFLTNHKVVNKLKRTAIDTPSGGMVMGYNNLFTSAMGVIDGYEVYATANVPSNLDKSTTTGVCSALIFGDFSQVVIGQFGGVELIVDPYTAARTGTIQYTINQSFDQTILQPALLGAILDLTTTG